MGHSGTLLQYEDNFVVKSLQTIGKLVISNKLFTAKRK